MRLAEDIKELESYITTHPSYTAVYTFNFLVEQSTFPLQAVPVMAIELSCRSPSQSTYAFVDVVTGTNGLLSVPSSQVAHNLLWHKLGGVPIYWWCREEIDTVEGIAVYYVLVDSQQALDVAQHIDDKFVIDITKLKGIENELGENNTVDFVVD